MGDTLQGNTVVLFGTQRDIAAYPVIQLGIDETGQARPVGVAPDGRVATGDGGPAWTTSRGVGGGRFTSSDASAGTSNITDAPRSGQKLVITDLLISSDTDLRLDFSMEDDMTIIESIRIPANSTMQITPRGKWKLPNADKKLQVQTSAAGNISVTAFYYSEVE